MKTYPKFAVLFLITTSIFSACASVKPEYDTEDKKLAGKVVEQYHRLYNEQNYEEIFNTAHKDAKATKSKEGLGYVLAEAFEKYGKHISSELVYSKVTSIDANQKQVEFAYQSKFERGVRNETFLIVTNDQQGALYAIGELSDDELKKLK
ncbi:MAG TPA: hypothetical protein VNB22_12565 [Pyrinomonadaceae bacterium]|jgi:hypothetical protein|nr:hypothetical protein [Pyrinomonadaceae bacterium]